MPLEQRAVRQVGQRVVMCQMLDPRFDAASLGDVFQRGGPATVGRALVDEMDQAAIRDRDHRVVRLVSLGVEEFLAVLFLVHCIICA